MNQTNLCAISDFSKDRIHAFYFQKWDTSKFLVGNIIQKDSEGGILLGLLDPAGKSDGFLSCNLSAMYRIEYDTAYLQQFLNAEIQCIPVLDHTCWGTLLHHALKSKIAIQLLDCNGKYILANGFVINFTEKMILLQQIRKNGTIGAVRKFQKQKVGFIFCGTESELALMQQCQRVEGNERYDHI